MPYPIRQTARRRQGQSGLGIPGASHSGQTRGSSGSAAAPRGLFTPALRLSTIQRRGTPPKYSSAMRHRPVTDLLVRHRLDPGQPGVGRNEDLHVLLAATGAQRQRLAREVRQAIQPRLVGKAHLRFRTTAAVTLLQQRAELAIGYPARASSRYSTQSWRRVRRARRRSRGP